MEQTIDWPDHIQAPPELSLRPGARGQTLQSGFTNLEPRTSFNTIVRASSLGTFAIPSFKVKVNGTEVAIPPAQLQVVSQLPPGMPPAQRLMLLVQSTNLYVGQPCRLAIILQGSGSGMIQALTQPQLTGTGFLVDQSSMRPRIEPYPRSGGSLAYISEMTAVPIAAGKHSLFAQGFAVGSRLASPVIVNGQLMYGGLSQYTLLDSDPVEIEAKPLPPEGKPPGFTGAIGSFALGSVRLSTNSVPAGEPLLLSVMVRGDGNISRLVPPPPPRSAEWRVLPARVDSTPPQIVQAQGYVTFTYTLIPVTERTLATPPIPFGYFNPNLGRYEDLTIPPMPVSVLPPNGPIDTEAIRQAEAVSPPAEEQPAMAPLAQTPGRDAATLSPLQTRPWFGLVQAAPAVAFAGLWGWDRRRRYNEKHPYEVRCRRARRALRRERRVLRRFRGRAEADSFAAAAVNAMRTGCAPHFPAVPQALTGNDVLWVLRQENLSPGQENVVRSFFSVTDAARFGKEPTSHESLLGSAPLLESVLEKLEARLCV
jgi:hypothetical protein